MRYKQTFYFILLVLCSCCVFTYSNISALAQSSDDERRTFKPFGASLKSSDKKNKDKAKNKKQMSDAALEDEFIRIETTLIINDILVSDNQGNPVKNLKKDDFIIRENDEPQEIESFAPGDSETIPRSIVLLIDYSGSQLPYIETSVEAAKILVDKLNPKDRMAIVTDDVQLLQDFTNDKPLLKEKLESLKKSALSGTMGRSRQFSALMAILNEMFDSTAFRPIIIFQTDGDELPTLKGETANLLLSKKDSINFSYDNILTAAEKARATIYTIIPAMRFTGMSEDEMMQRAKTNLVNTEKAFAEARNIVFKPNGINWSEKNLKSYFGWLHRQQSATIKIAEFTGGWANYLEHPEQADKIYSEILSGINMRYIIGYYPTNQTRDGKVRQVKTEVRGHPEYVISARKTYILAAENKRQK